MIALIVFQVRFNCAQPPTLQSITMSGMNANNLFIHEIDNIAMQNI